MNPTALFNSIRDFFTPEVIWTILWIASGVFTMVVLALMNTRWGQARPLVKCIVLSVLAHILLLGYAQMTSLFEEVDLGYGEGPDIRSVTPVKMDETEHDPRTTDQPRQPWETVEADIVTPPDQLALTKELVDLDTPPQRDDVALPESLPSGVPLNEPVATDHLSPGDYSLPNQQPKQDRTTGVPAQEIDAPKPQGTKAPEPLGPRPAGSNAPRPDNTDDAHKPTYEPGAVAPNALTTDLDPKSEADKEISRHDPAAQAAIDLESGAVLPSTSSHKADGRRPASASPAPIEGLPEDNAVASAAGAPNNNGMGEADAATANVAGPPEAGQPKRLLQGRDDLPKLYRYRVLENRVKIAEENGGNARTEAAVEAALAWLAGTQNENGGWDASRYGSGRETRVFGHDRQGAGESSDTAVTALAVLAFMGAGHTHEKGDYRLNVQRGLEFLINNQATDGNLAGEAKTFAAMYCHSMATFALAEGYAMTKDARMKRSVEAAINYTVRSQSPRDGGWRYKPGDSGDTSQFGWQVMALKAAAEAGIAIPNKTRLGMQTFLGKVSSGRHGGLASYRPVEAVSETMTAEALACRFFLGVRRDDPAIDEAATYLLKHRPARGRMNLYYWYYGTLAMNQVQDERWEAWNLALQQQMLAGQIDRGRDRGTWPPENTVWGGYGGRVYTTALGALILESYYRYAVE